MKALIYILLLITNTIANVACYSKHSETIEITPPVAPPKETATDQETKSSKKDQDLESNSCKNKYSEKFQTSKEAVMFLLFQRPTTACLDKIYLECESDDGPCTIGVE